MADLDLNFLDAFPAVLSVSKSSISWDWSAIGELVEYPANTGYIAYDPLTLEKRGCRVQSGSTQHILNSSASGASAPSTLPTGWQQWNIDGLTHEVVGTGTENGLPYIDVRVYGTPSSDSGFAWWPMGYDLVAGTVDQVWTGSVFTKIVSGTMDGLYGLRLVMSYYDMSDTEVGRDNDFFFSPPSASTPLRSCRKTFTSTVFGTEAVKVEFWFETNHGTDPIDVTFRFAVPQLENKRKASTPMLTSGATFTRAPDQVFMNLLTSQYSNLSNIVFCQFRNESYVSDGLPHAIVSLNDGNGTDIVQVKHTDAALDTVVLYRDGSVEVAGVDAALTVRTLSVDAAGRLLPSPTSGTSTTVSGNGTIASGGTAQQLFGGTVPARGYSIHNPGTASLWVSAHGTAAPSTAGSFELLPGSTYVSPSRYVPSSAVSIYGSVTGQPFTAERW